MDKTDGDDVVELNAETENDLLYEGDDEVKNENENKDETNGDEKTNEEKIQDENKTQDDNKIQEEHFSKTKPEEFSSENFKIELGGLPKFYPLSQLKKLLNQTLQLDAHRVKPAGMGRNIAYVNFKDQETKSKAMVILNGYKWQGVTLTTQEADPAKDPMLLAQIDFLKVPKKEYEQLPLSERIQKAVTPYHGMPYEDQIKEKDKVVKSVLRKYGNELSQLNPELQKFVHWHKIRRKGQVCELDDFVESPVKEGYRNKCEFTIGKNKESEKPVVGFRVASYKEGSIEVGPVAHLTHLNEKMKEVVKLMEKYLETSSYEPFDPFSHKGVWRQLTVRTSNNNDVMIVIIIHPQEMDEEEINGIREDVKLYFTEGEGVEVGVTSIFFQQLGQKESGKEPEYEHIYGKTYIEETILGKTFRASPDAFLQVNTPACEVLYEKIAEVAEIDSTSIVLDICCGVGTIGLSVAEGSYKCMGVEMVETAVEDARANADANGIANAVFYNGKAEDYIENMIERSQRNNVVAIVDPPRAGLSGTVMNTLRKCEYLNKLVYVSCDPQAALPNFQALGRQKSKTYKGGFFVPVRATPVDLFPDTPHFELIIVFERYDDTKWDRIMNGNPRPKDQAYFDRIPPLSQDSEKFQKEREEKRKSKNDEKRGRRDDRRRSRPQHNRRDDWEEGRDRNRRDWRGYGDGEDDGGGGGGRGRGRGRGGGGGGGNWRSGGELGSWQRVASNDNDGGWNQRRGGSGGGGQQQGRQEYGEGFQEGFQAGLEAMGGQMPGFGQGGGWNMAQTRGGYGDREEEEDFSMNQKESQVCGWDYTGNTNNMNTNNSGGGGILGDGPGSSSSHSNYQSISTQPVTYPTSVTHPQGSGYSGGWNQTGNWGSGGGGAAGSGGGTGGGGNYSWNQGGSNQYQGFDEPAPKKWKGPGGQNQNLNTVNFDYSSY